jgi:hypothetical protein
MKIASNQSESAQDIESTTDSTVTKLQTGMPWAYRVSSEYLQLSMDVVQDQEMIAIHR